MTKVSELTEVSTFQYLKSFSKRMLKTHLFMGSFHEKRFVESLGAYRDVVRIDPEETKLIENLLVVKNKIRKISTNNPLWIGITEPETIGAPVGYNIWVELSTEIFGKYWFKVKTVEFLEKEIRLRLEVIRPLKNESKTPEKLKLQQNSEFDISNTIHDISQIVGLNLLQFYQEYVTIKNLKETVIFLTMLIGAILVGGVNIIKYLMEYLLKFIKETSGLLKTMTPIILSMMNVFGKTIQGLYSMIVTLWHGKQPPLPPVYNSYLQFDPNMMNAIQFNNPGQRYAKYFNNPKALPYNRRSGVTITSLDD